MPRPGSVARLCRGSDRRGRSTTGGATLSPPLEKFERLPRAPVKKRWARARHGFPGRAPIHDDAAVYDATRLIFTRPLEHTRLIIELRTHVPYASVIDGTSPVVTPSSP